MITPWFITCFLLSLTLAADQDAYRVLLTDAVKDGAVCLDGTAPGYYFKEGMYKNL